MLDDRLTIIIPTLDPDRPLARCIESAIPQMKPGDEILVIGDTTDGPLPWAEDVVTLYGVLGSTVRYLPSTNGAHDWGHSQINYGITRARGSWLMFSDDDDIVAPGALAAIRDRIATLAEPRPLMFRMRTWTSLLLWAQPIVAEALVGGHMFVVPNIPERLGTWTSRYVGDFDFIVSTLQRWPDGERAIVWDERLIAICRPDMPPGVRSFARAAAR